MVNIVKDVAWPIVVLLFMFLFRTQIASLISRITSIDKSGVKTSQAPESQREQQNTEAAQELLHTISKSVVQREREERIKSYLKDNSLEVEGDTVKLLIAELATTQLRLEFEQIHNVIFGSQIFLMKRLNEAYGRTLSKEMVVAHFDQARKTFRPNFDSYSFDQYMIFLQRMSLVTVTGDAYHITDYGIEYLTWMTRIGNSENRPL